MPCDWKNAVILILRSNSISDKFAQRDVSRFGLLGRKILTVKKKSKRNNFYHIVHFISYELIYSLWLLRLRQRANIGHPRRYSVTLNENSGPLHFVSIFIAFPLFANAWITKSVLVFFSSTSLSQIHGPKVLLYQISVQTQSLSMFSTLPMGSEWRLLATKLWNKWCSRYIISLMDTTGKQLSFDYYGKQNTNDNNPKNKNGTIEP